MRTSSVAAAAGAAVGVVGVVLAVSGCGGQHSAASKPPPTPNFLPPGYLFDSEFNGPAGSKPPSAMWSAKAYRASSGTVWNGWRDISENGRGDLVITARLVGGVWYSGFLSGKIPYEGPRYVEVRAKVAAGHGVWNAPVWEWDYPHGATGLEDDVVEQLGRTPRIYRTTLHANAGIQKGFANATRLRLSSGFHTYAAAIRPNQVDYYFDGALVRTIRPGNLGGHWGFVTKRMVANISLDIGGLGGTPRFARPVSLLVDWIRVTRLSKRHGLRVADRHR